LAPKKIRTGTIGFLPRKEKKKLFFL